ncbi:uncharacterized protein LOC143675672 [Tamandua tetradactyla]|uniref:uncharacterized protein LOC143675672 n=1 Tax=Tamandua tetradactyla TaxID=48850 RepID=UPI004054302E
MAKAKAKWGAPRWPKTPGLKWPDAAGRKAGPPNLQHPHFLLLLLLLRGLRQGSGGGKGPLGVGDPDRYSGRAAAPAPLENGLRALAPPPRRRRKAPSLSFPKEWAPGVFRSDGHPRLGRRAARGQAGVGVPQGRRLRGRLETVRGRAGAGRGGPPSTSAGRVRAGRGRGRRRGRPMESPGAVRRPPPRLIRRRPPAGDGGDGPGPRAGRPRDPSWFLGDAASERDQLWSALLRAAGSDPSPAGDPLPPLPAAPGQDPRPGPDCEAPPEVFTVGPRAFLWTPLPPAPGAAGGLARSSSLPCAAGRHPGSLSVSSASSPRLHPTPEPPADPSAEELPSGEEPPALESCPMCQAPFGSTRRSWAQGGSAQRCPQGHTGPHVWHPAQHAALSYGQSKGCEGAPQRPALPVSCSLSLGHLRFQDVPAGR